MFEFALHCDAMVDRRLGPVAYLRLRRPMTVGRATPPVAEALDRQIAKKPMPKHLLVRSFLNV